MKSKIVYCLLGMTYAIICEMCFQEVMMWRFECFAIF